MIPSSSFFFFNDTATTEIYTLSLHDALPICWRSRQRALHGQWLCAPEVPTWSLVSGSHREHPGWHVCGVKLDRKSTRLNSSHLVISYAVFCLKKKKQTAENPDLLNT